MEKSKKKFRLLLILAFVFLVLLSSFFLIDTIVENIIEKKISNAIADKFEDRYHVSFGNISLGLLGGNVTLKDFRIKPDTNFLNRYKSGHSKMSSVMDVEVSHLDLLGLSILAAVTKGQVNVSTLEIADAKIKFYTGYKATDTLPEAEKPKDKKINLDSIQISGIAGLHIGKIQLVNCSIEVYNLKTDSEVVTANEIDVTVDGIRLDKLEGEEDYFKLVLDDLKFTLVDEKLSLPGGLYFLTFGKLDYERNKSFIMIQNLKIFPQYSDLYEMAKKLVYTSEIFKVGVDQIDVYNFNLRQIINENKFFVDSITVSKLDLDILKDKRFPWNYEKRPQLPNHSLRTMKFPLYIGEVNIKNSRLYYHEIIPDQNEQMMVSLDDLNVKIKNVTSVKDSIATGKPMTINLNSNLMNTAPLQADFVLQLNSTSDNFSFSGYLGKANMTIFNQALKPATGAVIDSGVVDMVTFEAKANNTFSTGTMKMVYSGFKAKAMNKKDDEKEDKFLSFLANTVVFRANPNKQEKLRVAEMGFERVMYKGFGNFVWKTLQTGIVNTVLPTGKSKKEVKEVMKKSEKQTKKEKKENLKKK